MPLPQHVARRGLGLGGLAGLLLVILGLVGMHGLVGGAGAAHGPGHGPGHSVAAPADLGPGAGGGGIGYASPPAAPGESAPHDHLVDLCLAVLAGLLAAAALLAARGSLRVAGTRSWLSPRARLVGGRRPPTDLLLLQVCRT